MRRYRSAGRMGVASVRGHTPRALSPALIAGLPGSRAMVGIVLPRGDEGRHQAVNIPGSRGPRAHADPYDRFSMPTGAAAPGFPRLLNVFEHSVGLRRGVTGHQHLVEDHVIQYPKPFSAQLLCCLLSTSAQPIDQFFDTLATQDFQRCPEFHCASTA